MGLEGKMRKFYVSMTKKKKEIKNLAPIYLSQKDFDNGTYLLDKPGYYRLKEDIVFSPNAKYDYFPRKEQTQYNTLGFSLGFFTALAIYADGVYLDLNGFSISASKEFALQQRFFSIIELANTPFIKSQGPGNFSNGDDFKSASNVIIANGRLGLSSHHGIHGNLVNNILIEDLTIENFEFVGVAINGVDGLCLFNVDIKNNRKDVPVLATYSAARFARLFAKRMLDDKRLNNSQKVELGNRLKALELEMNTTFNEIMTMGKTKSKLFRNESGLPDGNMYGVLVKDKGFAVNELVTPSPSVVKSQNVFLRKVKVENMESRPDEVIALSQKDKTGAQTDVAGAVLQIEKIKDNNDVYIGTVLSELQLYLASLAISLNIQIGKNNITQDVIDWAKNKTSISQVLQKGYVYKCNGDSMHHAGKGLVMYRFDAVNNLVISKCKYIHDKNKGCLGSVIAGPYEKSHDASKRKGYLGDDIYGISFSYVSNALVKKFVGEDLKSKDGNATGINCIFGCENIKIDEVTLADIKAGTFNGKKWKGEDHDGNIVSYTDVLPNKKPLAVGLLYEKGSVTDIKDLNIHHLKSCEDPKKVDIISPLPY